MRRVESKSEICINLINFRKRPRASRVKVKHRERRHKQVKSPHSPTPTYVKITAQAQAPAIYHLPCNIYIRGSESWNVEGMSSVFCKAFFQFTLPSSVNP